MSTQLATIYSLRNIVNDKRYIGQTIHLKNRIRQHKNSKKGCVYLVNAIKKYGWDNFELTTCCEVHPEDLDKAEIFFIEKYNTTNSNKGYNIWIGGNVSRRGIKLSEEHKQKISLSRIGIKNSEETRKKLSDALKGRVSTMKGKHHSEYAKNKNRDAHLGKIPWNKGKHPYNNGEKQHPMLGKHHSEEAKLKMSIARLGIGHSHSEETRKKLSLITKAYWERKKLNKEVPHE